MNTFRDRRILQLVTPPAPVPDIKQELKERVDWLEKRLAMVLLQAKRWAEGGADTVRMRDFCADIGVVDEKVTELAEYGNLFPYGTCEKCGELSPLDKHGNKIACMWGCAVRKKSEDEV